MEASYRVRNQIKKQSKRNINTCLSLSEKKDVQWLETLRLKDLLIQAFKLPPFFAPLMELDFPSPSLTTFVSSGFLHRVKFLAPSDPIALHALKAIATKPKPGSVNQFN